MKRERVIFLIYHGQGHFNACFKIAKMLSSQYDVTFAGHAYFQSHVVNHQFEFYSLSTVPFGLGFENWVNTQEKKKYIWWSSLRDRITNRLFSLRQHSLREMVEKLQPAYILIDSWQSTDFVALYKTLKEKSVKVAFIQTMLSTVIDDTPPLTSDAFAEDRRATKNAFIKFRREQLTKTIKEKLKWLGWDNQAIVDRAISQTKINPRYISESRGIFSPVFNLTEFILAPIEFEFPERNFRENQYHIGNIVDLDRTENITKALNELLARIHQSNEPLVYCSFGTTELEDHEIVTAFLPKLIATLENLHLQCILTSGTERLRKIAHGKSARLHVFQHVPQLHILKLAKVFITHGGLNSIKEAIAMETPMLVYPARNHTDNPGNGARVLCHQLGLVGDLKRDSIEDISDRLCRLLTTNNVFKENLDKLNQTISEKYDDKDFIDPFEKIKPVE